MLNNLSVPLALGRNDSILGGFSQPEFTVVLAAILSASPVAGLRPIRAARCAFTTLPSPGTVNSPYFPGLGRRGLDQQIQECRDLLWRVSICLAMYRTS